MNPWQQLLLVWLVAVLAQSLGWLWQRKRTNAGIVDVVWSFGVGGAAWHGGVRADDSSDGRRRGMKAGLMPDQSFIDSCLRLMGGR